LHAALQIELGAAASILQKQAREVDADAGTGIGDAVRAITLESEVSAGILPYDNQTTNSSGMINRAVIGPQGRVLLIGDVKALRKGDYWYLRLDTGGIGAAGDQ
jgi:hypothetical protein